MKAETTTLYFKRGSSDKQYTVTLRHHEDDWWDVLYAYGRRGGPQKTCLKTEMALPYEEAKVVYDKLIHAKQLKGYTADGEAIAFADNPNAGEDTGFRPQLLNEVTLKDAEDFYLTNMPSVAVQTKWDGERRAAILKKGIPNTFTNRKGQAKGIRDTIDTACTELIEGPLIHSFQLDCEDMGEYLVVFDILSVNEIDMTGKSFAERAESLIVLDCMITHAGLEKYIRVEQPTYPTSLKEFRWLIEHARVHNEEGVVIRLASAPYEPGKPATGGPCLKYKFIGEATCMVIGDVKGKRSMEIAVRSDSFPSTPNKYVPVGKVTIPPNYEMPEIGDLVEVRYMNIMKGDGAKLFQPRYKGLRTDKTKADLHSSLKFKKED
jgi:bifunctional non-homologous end joining protein LigD